MKKTLSILTLVALLAPQAAFATRLHTMGFEWQSVTTGVEFTSGGTSTSIDTSIKHSGSASIKVNPSAAFEWFGHDFGALSNNDTYVGLYFYVTSAPSAGTVANLIAMYDATGVSRRAHVTLDENMQVKVFSDADAQLGATSATLNTGQWYRLDFEVSEGGFNNMSLRIDGQTIVYREADASGGTFDAVYIGSPAATATFDINFDDITINDTTLKFEDTWTGPGSVAIIVPTGNGDSNCDSGSGDWANVDEIPPDNTATAGGSDICELDTTTSIGDFAATDSSTAGIGSTDVITAITVLGRVREETAGATNYTVRLKSASGGAVYTNTSGDAGNTTVRTNPSGTTAWASLLSTSTDPTTRIRWTPTGTNSIDNMQIGAATTDGNPDTWLTTLAAMVHYRTATSTLGPIVDTQSSDGEQTNQSSISWSHTCNSCTLLVVGVGMDDGTDADRTITAMTYNGDTMTKAHDIDNDTNDVTGEIWYIVNPDTGTNTISVTFNGANTKALGTAVSFTNTDTSSPLDTTGGASYTNDDFIENSITTGGNNYLVFDVFVDAGGDYAEIGHDQQALVDMIAPTGTDAGMSHRVFSTAGSNSMYWVTDGGGGSDGVHVLASFKVAGGTPATNNTVPRAVLQGRMEIQSNVVIQ